MAFAVKISRLQPDYYSKYVFFYFSLLRTIGVYGIDRDSAVARCTSPFFCFCFCFLLLKNCFSQRHVSRLTVLCGREQARSYTPKYREPHK